MTLKLQWSEGDKARLLRETEEQSNTVRNRTEAKPPLRSAHSSCDLCLGQMAELHQSLHTLVTDSELLRSQLNAVSQEKLSHTQDVTDLQKKLQDAENKVEV